MTHRLLVGGELVLYGDVGDMWGDGSGFTGRDVLEALTAYGEGDIVVRINSGGGFVAEGSAIYAALRAHKGEVTTYADGIAASAASVIFMAGDRRVMRQGAMLMIHDPAAVTIGNAADHAKSADTLNKMGDMFAKLYAERTGNTVEEMRAAMLEETWMDAEEAVAFGFATETEELAAAAATPFDYRLFRHAPAELLQTSLRERPVAPVAHATTAKEPSMADQKPAVAAEDTAATKPRDYTREILNRCTVAKLSLEQANKIVDDAGNDLDKASSLIISTLADQRETVQTSSVNPTASVVADGVDRFREGATRSLMLKAGLAGGEVNEFSSFSLRELARHSMAIRGVKANTRDVMEMVGMAFRPTMAAMHSTSDFTSILADVANKSMLKGWDEAEETYQLWTARGSLPDFKVTRRVDLNLFPSLSAVPEGAEYTYGTIGDRGETIQLATYGKMFSITRQAIVNDDMSAFTRIPARMGRAARRTIGNLAYAVITDNAAMADGVALFHADHSNLGSGTITATNVDTLRAAMARQTDPDDHATGGLNIRPTYMLVPVELEGKARQLMAAEFDPSGTQRNPNIVRNLAQVISDARLSANSTTAWYLAANPMMHDTIEVAYLNGVETPVMEQQDGWNVDGVEFKVRIDAGVKALDFRGLQKSTGS